MPGQLKQGRLWKRLEQYPPKFPMSLLAGRISGCQYPRIGTSLSDLPAESQVEAREVDPGLPIPLR